MMRSSFVITILVLSIVTALPTKAQQSSGSTDDTAAYRSWYATRNDMSASLDAARAFLQKYPNSQYATYVKKWVTSARATTFNQAMEKKDMVRMLQLGKDALAENPNDLDYLYLLAYNLRERELHADPPDFSHATEAADYSRRAIALIEADKVPTLLQKDKFDKRLTLSWLYQTMAELDVNKHDTDAALSDFAKASSFDGSDAYNYLMIGHIHEQRYNDASNTYASEARHGASTRLTAAREKVNQEADAMIESWARFMAMSDKNAEYEKVRGQVSPALARLYKFRHPDSANGLQKLIDHYKAAR